MEYRNLGRSSLRVSSIGLGCVTFGREIDETASFDVMDRAIERGINLFDTAEAYSDRESERIIGRWLQSRQRRAGVYIATKMYGPMRRANIIKAIDLSLEALRIDCIDLFQLHHWPKENEPLDEMLEALQDAVRRGKVKHLGVSNATAAQTADAIHRQSAGGWSRFEAVQEPYSLVERDIEREILGLCAREQMGVLTYSPLAAGFLTGKYRLGGPIPKGTRFDVKPGHQDLYFKPENFQLLDRLRVQAERLHVPIPELALAWVLRRPGITCVLIGARSPEQVEQAFRAEALPISDDVFNEIVIK